MNMPCDDGPLEAIETLTLTALKAPVAVLLAEHGCTVFERGRTTIVTFPANTHQRMLWPRTHIEGFRIVLADGLELRYERDSIQARSELAVVLPNEYG